MVQANNSNKAKDFIRYKEKWGLTEYSFKIMYNNQVAVVPIGHDNIWGNGEIRTVHNLMKRRNNTFVFHESAESDSMEFSGLSELLEYMLIKKIAL